ncbi:MAG: pyruvate, water dikinase regulatory protein [Pseudomonadota bacterium]|nr:pyruvate, water dikinase regulatory protein [Pseudomonadota bacterium]
MKRTVFFVSESTGITAETLGNSLLSQFEDVDFERVYTPYVNTAETARELVRLFDGIYAQDGQPPIVLGTMLNEEVRAVLQQGACIYVELYETFVGPLSEILGVAPSRKTGQSHAISRESSYARRIDAINFAVANDDGVRPENFGRADLILTGVSRSGKTPTCLYLATHFGLYAANYPLTEEDFERDDLPEPLRLNSQKLFGLTIDAERLHQIRVERRPGGSYASLDRCRSELRQAQRMFTRLGIPVLDTTSHSIEEISSRIRLALKYRTG